MAPELCDPVDRVDDPVYRRTRAAWTGHAPATHRIRDMKNSLSPRERSLVAALVSAIVKELRDDALAGRTSAA